MSSYIRDAGHEPSAAQSGEEALQMLEHSAFDLIIMDVEMPGLDGFETTRLMREWLGDRWIPIIFATGKTDEKSVEEGIEAGGDDYLNKPVSSIILKAKIRAMERIIDMRNQLNEMYDELERLSQRDGLTKLYNRRTFNELSKQQWAVAKRTHSPISVIMLDIDHFKLFNDHYGHQMGDTCLQQVAEALQKSVRRPTDIVARYGGEEFIVLLPDTDISGARQVGENIRQSIVDLQIPHDKSTTEKVVTASIGVATCTHTTGRSFDNLIEQSDNLLYRSKKEGRNRISYQETDSQKTILVADDDAETLNLLTSQLSSHCNIVTADNGSDCIALAKSISPDLLLLDIEMPDIDGLEVCRQLRSQPETRSIPILLIAEQENAELEATGKEVGANDYLEKPFDERNLIAKINRYMI
ncbi:diguanylate cyclase [Aestuariirhabdus sp. Z084]|nr:diguanylate cyclase [Aestuariirhabdus haliotis]MCL6420419.1 diguanylate cyclase [Aestuariirhabdus haliotis]